MMLASGLDKHGTNSSNPLKYSHLDIAGSAGTFFRICCDKNFREFCERKFFNFLLSLSLLLVGDHPEMPTGAPLLAMAKTHLI